MANTITNKELSLDIDKVIKRVKLDIKNDWFQDHLKYEDILDAKFVSEKLEKYNNKNQEYKAGKTIHFDIPKRVFTIRFSSETDIIERVIYQSLVEGMTEQISRQ